MVADALEHPIAVVIGAGGMGLAVARRLGQDHRIILADIDETRLAEAVADLGATGLDAQAMRCDITDQASVEALASALGGIGGWTALAHVAGLSPSMGDARRIFEVNLAGAARVCGGLLPAARPGAAAVFISSVAGHSAVAGDRRRSLLAQPLAPDWQQAMAEAFGEAASPALAYQLSKLGMIMLCQREALAYARRGARIVSLSPGLIDTPMGQREAANLPQRAELAARIPLGRQGTMAEIADVVAFLVSPGAGYITGTDLLVDGGVKAAMMD